MPESREATATLIRLRAPYHVRGGALYAAGETVRLDPLLAASLVAQRLADPVSPEAEGTLAPATRAYPEPPVHRMVTAANTKDKEKRRGR